MSEPETVPATASETASETAHGPKQTHKCLYCCVEQPLCYCYFGTSYFNADGKLI